MNTSELVKCYKWEFIRRNKGYIKAYDSYVSIAQSPKYKREGNGTYIDRTTGQYTIIFETPHYFPLRKYLNPKISYAEYRKKIKNVDELIDSKSIHLSVKADCKQVRKECLGILPSFLAHLAVRTLKEK